MYRYLQRRHAPTRITNYALFHDGVYITNEQMNDKKSLADIVRILEVYDDREKLEQFFSARQEELETLSKDTAYKLTLLDAARKG